MKLWEQILQGIRELLTANNSMSSKRAAGLWMTLVFSVCVIVMVIREDYSMVNEAGILAGSLLGLGVLDKIFQK